MRALRVVSSVSKTNKVFLLFAASFLCVRFSAFAGKPEVCVYLNQEGKATQVMGESKIPREFKKQSKCFPVQAGNYLAEPEDIKLKGATRKELVSSAVGRIELRWPRKVEVLFGRTPERAVADAASTVSRTLKQAGFPSAIQRLNIDWKAVFMDEDVPETQIPTYLVTNCHPAWMTPIANLYVVAQRVVAGCSGGHGPSHQVADAELIQVLLHEMGHVVEYQILQGVGGNDKMRAEGFACWFEQYASDFSSVIPKGGPKRFYMAAAKQSIKQSPNAFSFTGSLEDYARSSMFFHAIVARRGVKGLMDVYAKMAKDKVDFFKAVEDVMGWDQSHFAQEVNRIVK